MSKGSTIALIPAAGSGTRMRMQESKALLLIRESPAETVIQRTVRQISASHNISHVVIMVRAEDLENFTNLSYGTKPVHVITGGASRTESVRTGLTFARNHFKDNFEYVLIHDAARCLVTPELVDKAIDEARVHKAVTVATRCSDTIKEVNDLGIISVTLNRNKLWAVQTPQVFEREIIVRAHSTSEDATDDASLIERFHSVHVVEGSAINIKITTRQDLEMVRRLMLTEDR